MVFHNALAVLLPFSPLFHPLPHGLHYIIFIPVIEIHPQLVVCPREGCMSSPCWYLVNLPRPAASVSQTESPHTWVLVSRDRSRSPGPPTRLGEGGRRDRGGSNKNTTWHPHGKQPTYCQLGHSTQPLYSILMTAHTHRHTHTTYCYLANTFTLHKPGSEGRKTHKAENT